MILSYAYSLCSSISFISHLYNTPLFFLYLSVRRTLYLICFFTLKALHTSKYLCWPLPHFFKFYHNTFKIEESELPTVFKINRYCGIILFFVVVVACLVFVLFCFNSFNNNSHHLFYHIYNCCAPS